MRNWRWNGARWWKFDFHTHTPASEDYGKGPDQANHKRHTPREWLVGYMKAGIDCVAVTDHNTGEWIDQLRTVLTELEKEKPDGFRPIHLFPGVELSVNGGIHVLAIFSPEKTTSDIDTLLGAADFDGTKGTSDRVTKKSFSEVVDVIHAAGGITVPAHVDANHGLFQLTGTTLQQAFADLIAMEVVDPSCTRPQVYNERRRHLTEVLGSDSHHPSGNATQSYPGSHFSWVKMAEPSLEGLRLALLDGPLSVRRSDQVQGDLNAHAPLVMESIDVSHARYMGRSKPFRVELNPWLNAIIGGRGTGKSSLLEFLRIALRRERELPESVAGDFEKYGRVYENRRDEGLLTHESEFVVTYRKNGARYRIQWSERGGLNPIEVEQENGDWEAEQGDITQRFPVRIYSQKQIFELAKAPLALLKIVDEAPGVDGHSWQEEWQKERTRFLSLRAKAREIEAGLAEEPRLRGELKDTKRKLAVFEEAGHANILKEYQQRVRQERAVENWQGSWSSTGDRLRELAADIVPDPVDATSFDDRDASDRELIEKSMHPIETLKGIRDKLEGLAGELDDLAAGWHKSREESPWKQVVDAAIFRYGELRRRLADEGAGDPSMYGELVQRRQTIEGRLDDLDARRKQAESIRRDADSCIANLLELRRRLTERRTKFIGEVLEGNHYVRIQVVPYGASETVEGDIRRLIQRVDGGFENDIGSTDTREGLVGHLYLDSLDTPTLEQRLQTFKTKIRDIAAGKHSASDLRDQRFASHLAKLPPEALDHLDVWFPEDTLDVEYIAADGASFRSIQEGSPGQKTAALLAFLLSYGEEPIVLDQPEDDLDNHLIYGLIVAQLRSIKDHRQVIVVTHNANIVVNGDAELILALAAQGGETHQECSGSLGEKEVRDAICAVMEGGRDAFERRYRRIVLESRYV